MIPDDSYTAETQGRVIDFLVTTIQEQRAFGDIEYPEPEQAREAAGAMLVEVCEKLLRVGGHEGRDEWVEAILGDSDSTLPAEERSFETRYAQAVERARAEEQV